MDVLTLLVLLVGELGLDVEGVCTEVITLSLEEVGWEVLGAVTIKPVEGGGETWGWDTESSGLADNVSPSWLSLVDSLVEEIVKEKILELWVVAVSVGDILQEDGTDNASSTPHEGNGRLVELPLVLLGSLNEKLVRCTGIRWSYEPLAST